MTRYALKHIAELLGVEGVSSQQVVEILLTDSRSLTFPEVTLFIPLVTAKGNGHHYIKELYQKGVRAFLYSEGTYSPKAYPGAMFLHVEDTYQALCHVAQAHREQLSGTTVVGITGSNGKTTVKELIYQLVGEYLKVGRSPKSYNSAIGVPLSLWSLEPSQDLALIEAGISKPNEMAVLEAMIAPEIGLLTNIGEAHQENFSSLREKLQEKLQLFKGTHTVIYPSDNTLVREEVKRLLPQQKHLYWSRKEESAPLYILEECFHHDGVEVKLLLQGRARTLELPTLDKGTLEDLYLAILLIGEVEPTLLDDLSIFKKLQPVQMRLEELPGNNGISIINDTYSSDYDSLRIALDFMKRRARLAQPTALVLSAMRESSKDLAELYQRVGQLVEVQELTALVLIGQEMIPYRHFFPSGMFYFEDNEAFIDWQQRTHHLDNHLILLKGARTAHFEEIVKALQSQTRQSVLEVNLSSIGHNLQQHRALLPQGTRVVCMIKADGYGVGAFEMAKVMEQQRADYLAVATVDEGKELRECGIQLPIIVLNPEESALHQMIQWHLEPEIYSIPLLRHFITMAEASPLQYFPIHLKWDTGMHRLGLELKDLSTVVRLLKGSNSVRVASHFTHLAAADDPAEDNFTIGQLEQLKEIDSLLVQAIGYQPLKHALNTAGIMRFPEYAWDMVRVGIGLYGISPIGQERLFGLETVATLHTEILQVRDLELGETVGYGRRGIITTPSRIGVIPLGYADGISRQLGNGKITFRTEQGVLVPTIGNICMDTLMLDLTNDPKAVAGSKVTIFGQGLPITRLSDACDTIPYEILSRLSKRITRRHFTE